MVPRRSNLLTVLFLASGVALCITNIALFRQNRGLKKNLARYRQSVETTPGTLLPTVFGHDLEGKPLVMTFQGSSRKSLLLVFSPFCGVCDDNWPNWDPIIKSADKQSIRVIGIDLSSRLTPEYIDRYKLRRISVITELEQQAKSNSRLGATPQTILVGVNGKVEKVWTGLLGSTAIRDIERSLTLTQQSGN